MSGWRAARRGARTARQVDASWWLGGLLFLFFAGWAVQLNYWGLWLTARGLTADRVAVVVAAGLLARAFSAAWCCPRLVRRFGVQRTLQGTVLTCVLLAVVFAVPRSFGALVLVSVLFGATYPVVMPLSETLLSHAAAAGLVSYGRVRLWGSVGFVAGLAVAASTIALWSATALVWSMVTLCAAQGLHVLLPWPQVLLAGAGQGRPGSGGGGRGLAGVGRGFWVVLVVAALVQGSHGAYYTFGAVLLGRQLGSSWWVAGVFVVAIGTEIVAFRWLAGLAEPASVRWLLLAGAAAGVLRWLLVACWPTWAVLLVSQPLHAGTFAATHFGFALFVRRDLAPARWAAAHGAYAAGAMSLAVAAGSLLAGALVERRSIAAAFGAMAVMSAAALLAATLPSLGRVSR